MVPVIQKGEMIVINDYYVKYIYELLQDWDFVSLLQSVEIIKDIVILWFFLWLGFTILKGGIKRD